MAIPKSDEINPQLRALLDRALFETNGLQVKMDHKKAQTARFGMYNLRERERKASTKFYEPGDLNYGKSPWETLSISIIEIPEEPGTSWLRIMPGIVTLEGLDIFDPVTGAKLD